MRILYSWLAEFVDGLPGAAELAKMLTERGVEAEVITPLADGAGPLQAVKVLRKLPGDDAPFSYEVEGADGKAMTLASRAGNIPDGYTVLASAYAIPTLDEMGVAPVRFPLCIPEGMAKADVEADCVIDFAVVSNRGDLLSHLGMAREAAVACGGAVKMPQMADAGHEPVGKDRPVIELPAPDLCPRYVGCYLGEVRIAPSPAWLAYRISLCGAAPISNIVDLSNYVLFELGQPLHTFDRDLLHGAISARRAAQGEKFTAINHVEYTLADSHLVIADAKHAVAIAGIMGGVDSEISAGTKGVLLESAYFTPRNIRVSCKRIGLQSESSQRFGRGTDPTMPPRAARRFIKLAEDIGAAKYIAGSMNDANVYVQGGNAIAFDCVRINALLGSSFSDEQICGPLTSLGFTIGKEHSATRAMPPAWRHDIERWEDLAEETLRVNLFDALKAKQLVIPLKSGRKEMHLEFIERAEDALLRMGAQQIVSQPFISPRRAAQFHGEGHSLVALLNPDSADQAFIPGSLLPGMLAAAEHNRRHGQQPPLMFECARIFSTKPFASAEYFTQKPGSGEFHEQQALGLMFGDGFITPAHIAPDFSAQSPLFMLKGSVDALLDALGIAQAVMVPDAHPGLAGGKSFALNIGDENVGFIGEVDNALMEAEGGRIAYAQLSLDALMKLAHSRTQALAFSPYPAMERDLALLLPSETRAESVLAVIREACGALLTDVYPFDIFSGKQVAAGQKSVAFHLVFQAERTLSGAEVDELIQAALGELRAKLGAVVRE